MKNLIPHFVHEQFQAQNHGGRFQAATLFVDISGFTPLTETLMRHRKDGAEVLTGALNRIFGPLVSEVYAHGGFISTFAGDAFTALFPLTPGDDAPLGALRTAFAVQRFFAQEGRVQTRYGQFEMGVRVGKPRPNRPGLERYRVRYALDRLPLPDQPGFAPADEGSIEAVWGMTVSVLPSWSSVARSALMSSSRPATQKYCDTAGALARAPSPGIESGLGRSG